MRFKIFGFARLLAVNLLTLAVLLWSADGVLFLLSPRARLPIDNWEDSEIFTWGHKVVTNRFGFRERDFGPKASGAFRVMVLGDSLTWGAGLAVDERYTNRAEVLLAQRELRKQVEILNFGIAGGALTGYRDNLRRFGPAVSPDLVVVGFCFNDPQPRAQDYSIEREQLERSHPDLMLFELGLNYLFPNIGERWKATRLQIWEQAGWIPTWPVALDRTYDLDSVEWRRLVEALREIKDFSDQLLLPPPIFLVLNSGSSSAYPTSYRHPDPMLQTMLRWYHQAQATAREAGFVTRNFEREMADRLDGQMLAVNALDAHPSALQNEIYAEGLAQMIADIVEPGGGADTRQ